MGESLLHGLMPLALLICVMCEDWNQILDYQGTIPSYVFRVPMGSNMRIEVSVSWTTTADLDVYLYPPNTNFMSLSNYVQFATTASNPEIMTFTCGVVPADYYIRVSLAAGPPTQFTMQYSIYTPSNTVQTTVSQTEKVYDTNQAIEVVNFYKQESWSICEGRISYIGPSAYLKIVKPTQTIDSSPYKTLFFRGDSNAPLQIDLPQRGDWKIVLHSTNALTDLQSISLSVQIDQESDLKKCEKYQQQKCEDGKYYDKQTRRCRIKYIFYTPLITGFLVCVYVCLCVTAINKYFQYTRTNTAVHPPNELTAEQSRVFQQSMQQLDLSEKSQAKATACSICLDESKLLASLQCGHFFHQKCIKAWLRKTNSCPLCRISVVPMPQSHTN